MTRALGEEFACRDCGKTVRWSESKSGSKYLAQRKDWRGDDFGSTRTYWPSHRCIPDPAWQALYAEKRALEDGVKAAKEAAAANGVVAPEGRVRDIKGTITKIVNKGDKHFPEWKMTVATDEGWSCWMTIPAAHLTFAGYPLHQKVTSLEVGDEIVFTATVTRSDRDALFAFGKRPIVTLTEETVAAKEQTKIAKLRQEIADNVNNIPVEWVEEAASRYDMSLDAYRQMKIEKMIEEASVAVR